MKQFYLSLCFWILCTTVALAQTAEVSGFVKDKSGAVIPKAKVLVVKIDTAARHATATNDAGIYSVPGLEPGKYEIHVDKEGFRTLVREDVTLEVDQRARIDLTLDVGEAKETITVQGGREELQTTEASVGSVIGGTQIAEMPLNGRNFQQLTQLVPGAVPNYGGRDSDLGGVSLSGTRSFDNSFLIDGAGNNPNTSNFSSNVNLTVSPNLDAIQEFKIQSSSYSAKYGNTVGGVINLVTKMGTNQFHGTGYDYLRNSALNANTWQNNLNGIDKPGRIRNQFGGVLGGPIVLPKVYDGRNRTFFFVDYEGVREKLPGSFVNLVVPDAKMRIGDFSEFLPGGSQSSIQSFKLADPFVNNVLPGSLLDPAARQLAALYPLPNVAGSLNYRQVEKNSYNTDNVGIRIDQKLSEKDSLFGRYTETSATNETATWSQLLGPTIQLKAHGNLAIMSETHVFSPFVVNEIRAAYSHARQFRLPNGTSRDLFAEFGVSGIPPQPGLPTGLLTFSGLPGVQSIGRRSGYYNDLGNTRELADTVNWMIGTHHLQFGGMLRPLRFTHFESQDPRGEFDFFAQNAVDSAGSPQTVGFAQFLTGLPSRVSFSTSNDIIYQQWAWDAFLEDTWRITPSFALTLGIRYDRYNPVTERHDNQANFDVDRGVLVFPKSKAFTPPASFAGIPVDFTGPRGLVQTDTLNFAPRLGFAYSLNQKTVLRGGYGVFYGFQEIGPWSYPSLGYNPPFNMVFSAPPTKLSSGYVLDPLGDPNAQFQIASLPAHLHTPRVQQWNVSLQRTLARDLTLETTYSGSAGHNLYALVYFNQAYPGTSFQDLQSRMPYPYIGDPSQQSNNDGYSSYNALLVRLEKRFSSGLSILASYSYGHTLDNASDANQGTVHAGDTFRDPRHTNWEYGNSDFDIRHRFVFSSIYDLPVGHGRRLLPNANRLVDGLIGGWQFSGIWTKQTGYYFTPFGVNDSCFCNDGNANSLRPDIVPGQDANGGPRTPAEWFNIGAFNVNVPAGRHGNAGRNTILGPGLNNLDFALHKRFRLSESLQLQFRGEFFDVFNHPNFDQPDTKYSDSTVGQILSSRTAREGQLALKLVF